MSIYKVLQVNCILYYELSHNMLLKLYVLSLLVLFVTFNLPVLISSLATCIYRFFVCVTLDFLNGYESCRYK